MIQGLGGALFESIEFENGRIKNPRFSNYRVRGSAMFRRLNPLARSQRICHPRCRRNSHHDRGAGHRNAIFDATAVRLNDLPMAPMAGSRNRPHMTATSFQTVLSFA